MFILLALIITISYIIIFSLRNIIETNITFLGKGVQSNTPFPQSFEEITVNTPTGGIIHGVFLDMKMPKTIFYFHGNAGPISYYTFVIEYFGSLGYNVLCYDYPGYGKSTGYPLESETYKATEYFFDYIKNIKNVSQEDLIVCGHSIGTGIGSEFAREHKIDRLILVSPLTSRYDISKFRFGITLQKIFFMKNTYIISHKIKDINIPTLIIHGKEDKVIPYEHGKIVFENSSSQNKFFITLDGFGHGNIFQFFGSELRPIFSEFLEIGKLGAGKTQVINL